MKNIYLFFILILALVPGMVAAQQPFSQTKKLVLEVEWEPEANVEIFVAEGQRFNSVDTLKKFLDKQAAGTTVIWDPGCVRVGNKPLLSSAKEIRDLSAYLEKRGIKFVVLPSS